MLMERDGMQGAVSKIMPWLGLLGFLTGIFSVPQFFSFVKGNGSAVAFVPWFESGMPIVVSVAAFLLSTVIVFSFYYFGLVMVFAILQKHDLLSHDSTFDSSDPRDWMVCISSFMCGCGVTLLVASAFWGKAVDALIASTKFSPNEISFFPNLFIIALAAFILGLIVYGAKRAAYER